MRAPTLLLLACLFTTGCPSSKDSPGRIDHGEAGARAPEFVLGDKRTPIPPEDLLTIKAQPAPIQDEAGKRHAYRINANDWRLIYVVGGSIFVGPTTKDAVDWKEAPDLDRAMAALFENAGTRRADLVREVAQEKGDAGVARLLSAAAHVDDPAWDEAFAKLPPPHVEDVKKTLAASLEHGKDPSALTRAVRLLPLREPARLPVLTARIRELAFKNESQARPVAVLLRAVAAMDKAEGAKVACDVWKQKPADEVLREAALLALAHGSSSCAGIADALGKDWCRPFLRCGPDGPLSGREPTKQDEPLCTKDDLGKAIAKELDRKPEDVLVSATGARPELFAYAVLVYEDKLPKDLGLAHDRRRYAIVQPKEPACDQVEPGKSCHCEEAVIRDYACRKASAGVHTSMCKFDIDDEKKKITNVASVSPP